MKEKKYITALECLGALREGRQEFQRGTTSRWEKRRGPVNEAFTKVYGTIFQGMQIGQSKENIGEGAIYVILLLTISVYLC